MAPTHVGLESVFEYSTRSILGHILFLICRFYVPEIRGRSFAKALFPRITCTYSTFMINIHKYWLYPGIAPGWVYYFIIAAKSY